MKSFRAKNIQRVMTLGERLKKVRNELGYSLDQVSQGTKIRKEYLLALEEGNYYELPGPVYVESFLKSYAEYLEVSSDFVLSLYHDQEQKTVRKKHQRDRVKLLPRQLKENIVSPKLVRLAIMSLVGLVVISYIVYSVVNIFSPPFLEVKRPFENFISQEGKIEIIGQTEPEADLVINGKNIFLDKEGNFSEVLSLSSGLNEITISAKKERSKPTIVKRHVLYISKNNKDN